MRALGRITWMATQDAMNVSILMQARWWSSGPQFSSCLAEGNMGCSIAPGAPAGVLMPSLLLLCLHRRQGGTCGAAY